MCPLTRALHLDVACQHRVHCLGLVATQASQNPPHAQSHDPTTTTITPPFIRTTALLPQGKAEQQPRGATKPSPSGAVVIFDWVETLRDLLSRTDYDSAPAAAADDEDGQSSPSSTSRVDVVGNGQEEEEEEEPPEAEIGLEEGVEIVHGQAFTDRKSTFQAHLARVSSENQVRDNYTAPNESWPQCVITDEVKGLLRRTSMLPRSVWLCNLVGLWLSSLFFFARLPLVGFLDALCKRFAGTGARL